MLKVSNQNLNQGSALFALSCLRQRDSYNLIATSHNTSIIIV
ncbi:hypothetical protein VCR12J2_680101 [Vibrio coralliirubri]|nr:hypothetical protein VCR12J2_680101 [Vibrio coralliirubri]